MYKIIKEKYARDILIIYSFIILFRAFETTSIIYNHGYSSSILSHELFGLLNDILHAVFFILPYITFRILFSKFKIKGARIMKLCFLFLCSLIYLIIIKYFSHHLLPLDTFLFQYSIREILFTVSTYSENIIKNAIISILVLTLLGLLIFCIQKIRMSQNFIKLLFSFVIISLPITLLINSTYPQEFNKLSLNKPLYFITESIKHLSKQDEYSFDKTQGFKNLFPEKKFISDDFPLIHEAFRQNELGKYFKEFSHNPNIVVMIIEGLNDDFIHEYKGSLLMPYLNQLKDKSLYWGNCFTVGERSFAAVPSILGGLPYGDIGFTLQERIPRHLSLVSVLNSNDYFTSFFYGQGAWFHQKDRFFKHNNVNLLFDNSKFNEEYDKIIVGNNNFFWGYNDKDLLNQSLKVIDSINQNPRLDIYFTGTSHSPFVIKNKSYYEKKLDQISKEPYKDFHKTYSEYLTSVLFVDDAIKEFFNTYRKREDYKNTIFIITGDHPMTELPIENSLKRFHVPLLIFSDKLKKNSSFLNSVSHLDISETLLSFLESYLSNIPSVSTSLGEGLINKDQKHPKNIAFMNGNREVIDYLHDNYYLADDKLYIVDSMLNIEETENDSIKSVIKENLNVFNNTNLYVTREDKIISNELYCKELNLYNIYSNRNAVSTIISSEFVDLTDNIKLPNEGFVFDISLNATTLKKGKPSIVYEVKNSKDSLIIWGNLKVNENDITQAHIPFDKIEGIDDDLYFKSYIWNQDKSNHTIKDVNILLYTSQNKSEHKN